MVRYLSTMCRQVGSASRKPQPLTINTHKRSDSESQRLPLSCDDLIFVFVEEEVFLRGIIGPNVFDGLKNFTFVLKFVEIFYHFHGRARTQCVVNEFFLGGWPRRVFEF